MLNIKNISKAGVWVSFIPPTGRTLKPGEVVRLDFDPRKINNPLIWPRPSDTFQKLLEGKWIEIVPDTAPVPQEISQKEPAVVAPIPAAEPLKQATDDDDWIGHDDPVGADGPDGLDVPPTVEGKSTVSAETVVRDLPVIEPTVTYSEHAEQFTVDWSATVGLQETDKFSVKVSQPNKKQVNVAAGTERSVSFNAKTGPGEYSFTVTLTDADKKTSQGKTVSRTVV